MIPPGALVAIRQPVERQSFVELLPVVVVVTLTTAEMVAPGVTVTLAAPFKVAEVMLLAACAAPGSRKQPASVNALRSILP
ncbi:MAG: hypothetical protein ACREX0_02495 [Noviherbaspirillum sp.]